MPSSFDKGEEDVKTLVKALNEKPKFARLCIYTLNCFDSLAKNRNNLDRIVKEDGFNAILKTMRNHRDNSRVIIEGTAPLISACRVKEYAKKLGEEGGTEFCLEQLKTSKDKASNVQVAILLKSLCDGDPSNIDRIRDLGGEEILRKALKEANEANNPKLAASILNVLERLTNDIEFCKTMNDETIECVVDSLKRFPGERNVTIPAIKIVCNLVNARGDEMVEKLRTMDVVKLISNAMNANAADKMIAEIGKEALKKLSDQTDMENAIESMERKSIQTLEKAEIISLIGNLSTVILSQEIVEKKNILEKLAKIIKKLSKINKNSAEDQKLLISALKSAGKLAGKTDKSAKYFNKNVIDSMIKILKNKSLSPEILAAINISVESYIQNDQAFQNVLGHGELLPLLYEKNKFFKNDEGVREASIELAKNLGSKPAGLKKISQLNIIPLICTYVEENMKQSGMIIRSHETFISFTNNIDSISDDDILKMIDSAILALKDDPENIPVCKKALELLQALADTSQFARDKLSLYEYSSVLSKFKNETDEQSLKDAVDALKESLKQTAKTEELTIEQILKKISAESSKIIKNDPNDEALQQAYIVSELLSSALTDETKVKQLTQANAVSVLESALKQFKKAGNSPLRDDVLTNILKAINTLNGDGQYCEELARNEFYAEISAIYLEQGVSEELQAEIAKSVEVFKQHRWKNFQNLDGIDKSQPDYQKVKMAQIAHCTYLTSVLMAVPEELRGDISTLKEEIDIVVGIIQNNTTEEAVMLAAMKLLDELTSINQANRSYFTDNYVGSMCLIIKNNPDEDMLSSSILSMLTKYENDANATLEISDLKNWYINRTLETDLEALKLHLLDKAYNLTEDKTKQLELRHVIMRLNQCYDPKNALVNLNEKTTKADEEVAKLLYYLINGDYDDELKESLIALLKQMILNKNIEQYYYDSAVIDNLIRKLKESKSREERLVYMTALSLFMTSSNTVIQSDVQNSINDLLLSTINMNEQERMELLGDIISNMSDEQENILLSSQCLESFITMFELQNTADGKAKVLAIITKMIKSSSEVAVEMAEQKGLVVTMQALEKHKKSVNYVSVMTCMTAALAEHSVVVDKMFDNKVDIVMKDIMFENTANKDIFHNAQRTIDLMNIANLNMTPEQLEQWKSRSRMKNLMTELCRGLGIKISVVLTKGEREVRTGDTAKDISNECRRILNEFGSSFDEAIESNSSTKLLMWLGEAWLLRANLMAYTFLVEKDVSARSVINAPKTVEDTLVSICNFTSMWDFENKDFKLTHRAVRGGISHQSVRTMLDSSLESQPCQEVDIVTKEPIGREYSLEDLIVWIKHDKEEKDTLRIFNLVLSWVMTNWNLVTITASLIALKTRKGNYNIKALENDGYFLSIRCGLNWDWERRINEKNNYVYNEAISDYQIVEPIKKEKNKGGMHIKVKMSGEELRQKRRDIKDSLDFSHSNVLNGEEKDYLDFFIDVANKGVNCRKYTKQLLKTKVEPTFIKFNQEEDGDLYFSWGKEDDEFEKRNRYNMKELEGLLEGKKTKALKKSKEAIEDNCFSVKAAGDRDINLQLENKGDRDMWIKGMKLVLCTVANRKPSEMAW